VVRLSRREFVGAAGTLVLAAGCGSEAARTPEPSDAEVLDALLARELAVPALSAPAAAALLAHQDAQHARRLRRALRALGAIPPPGAPPPGDDPELVLARKQEMVFACLDALPRLRAPGLRELVMGLAASEAEHLAELRAALGREPVPDAFAGDTERA